ncbi:MAG: type II secretion system F family protein [Planctomycetota bacterium]
MKIAYAAIDGAGNAVRDLLEASSQEEAAEMLRDKGLFVTEINPASEGAQMGGVKARTSLGLKSRTSKTRALAMFSRQLQVMISTGTPLADGLLALERQTRDAEFRAVIATLRSNVEQGLSLSEAMQRHPEYFDQVYRNVVEAGETSGTLSIMLDRLAQLTKKQAQTRAQLMGAMVYPVLLILISIAVMVVMLTLVLPRFSGLFESLDVPLPASTEALMWASGVLRSYWWAILLILFGSVVGLRQWLATTNGRQTLNRLAVNLPKINLVTRTYASGRIARLLGTLLGCRITLVDALQLTRHATGNHLYLELMERAQDTVTRGDAMSTVFSDDKLIDPSLYEAIRNGEQTGKLSELMLTIAEFLDEENEVRLKSVTSLIEPLILIVLGLIVGGMAVSMFMPLFDLTSMAGGGH